MRNKKSGRSRSPTRISVTFDQEHYQEMRRIAERNKVSVAWVVRQAVDCYLKAETPLFADLQKGGKEE